MSEDKRFDLELVEQLADFDMTELPESPLPNPWERVTVRLLLGLGLSTIQLNFFCLQYILPALGVILLVQAFRPLRKENGWLRLCLWLSWVLCAVKFSELTVNATLISEWAHYGTLTAWMTALTACAWVTLYFALWRGLLAIGRKAGQEKPRADGALALLVWYLFFTVCALTPLGQMGAVAWLVIIAYLFVLRALGKVLRFMRENGYVLQPAPVRVQDGWLTAVWFALLIAAIALATAFTTRYPMDWQARAADEHVVYEETVEHLRTLGMPEEILRDLTGEDLAWLNGAQAVIVSRGGSVVGFSQVADGMIETVNAAVLVEREEGAGRWVMLHHFTWSRMPRVRLAEKVQVMPAYFRDEMISADAARPMTGRVLYEMGGTAMAAPFANIRQESYLSTSLFAAGPARDMWASYSIPTEADNFRGYVIYGVESLVFDAIQESRTHYVHSNSYFTYPYDPVAEFRRSSEWSIDTFFGGFLVIHSGKLAE